MSNDPSSGKTGPDDAETSIEALKARLDALRPISGRELDNLAQWYDVQLTYSSNAIEGNTLTHSETALVIEKGITISGKPLVSHMEAIDHFDAIRAMREIARAGRTVGENDVIRLHEIVLRRSRPEIAGRYAEGRRRITGSDVVFPAPGKLPSLMESFGRDLASAKGWRGAFEAHYRLVAIHPFADGNGRTARLLMNLILLRDGYPPVSIGPEHKSDYIATLERRSLAEPIGHGLVNEPARIAYARFMAQQLRASLNDHLLFIQAEPEAPGRRQVPVGSDLQRESRSAGGTTQARAQGGAPRARQVQGKDSGPER